MKELVNETCKKSSVSLFERHHATGCPFPTSSIIRMELSRKSYPVVL